MRIHNITKVSHPFLSAKEEGGVSSKPHKHFALTFAQILLSCKSLIINTAFLQGI